MSLNVLRAYSVFEAEPRLQPRRSLGAVFLNPARPSPKCGRQGDAQPEPGSQRLQNRGGHDEEDTFIISKGALARGLLHPGSVPRPVTLQPPPPRALSLFCTASLTSIAPGGDMTTPTDGPVSFSGLGPKP